MRSKLAIPVASLLLSMLLIGCSTIVEQHPITNQDILPVPEGSVVTFPAPVKVGYGPALTEVTTDRETYLLSDYYLKNVAKVKIEIK